jgi:hypothetical protein
MKTQALALTLALSFAGATLSLAQSPQMGTWKLNEAKSKIPAGAIKNTDVSYVAAGDNIKVTTDGFGTDGKPTHTVWTGKLDGKDYPITGDPAVDSRSYQTVSDHKLALTNKKGGKTIATGTIVVSPDGKTRVLTANSTNAAGKKITSTAFYDKQDKQDKQ